MTKQKINTPELYSKNTTTVIPTTESMGIYYALRYLYAQDKDVNAWHFKQKNKEKFEATDLYDVLPNINPWKTTNFRNGVK